MKQTGIQQFFSVSRPNTNNGNTNINNNKPKNIEEEEDFIFDFDDENNNKSTLTTSSSSTTLSSAFTSAASNISSMKSTPPISKPIAKQPTTPSKKKPAAKVTTPKKTPQKRKQMDDDDEDMMDNNEDDGSDYHSEEEEEEEEESEDEKTKSKKSSTPSKKKPSTPTTPTKKKVGASKKKDETRYDFLVNVRDSKQIPFGQEGYDPRTLYIPSVVLLGFTAFERQFWEIKARNYDTVVFFKKGKFYELYEGDADIGNEKFGLKMTDRVNMRMVGVPEATFGTWASKFIQAGYKVAKVDQMETSYGMANRQSLKGGSASKKDTIIQRELTSILTLGTLVDENMLTEPTASYLMSIKEDEFNMTFGVCFVDTAVGLFHLVSFKDDDYRSQLETLLLQTMPREVLLEKTGVSSQTTSLIKRILARQKHLINMRTPLEYWDAEQTTSKIRENGGAGINQEVASDQMMMCALGGCLSYLFDIKIGVDMVKQARYQPYNTQENNNHALVLDGQCLINLEIFNNTTDGSKEGTLFKVLDRCQSAFGKRLLRQWVCRPLCHIDRINERLDAVDVLGRHPSLFATLVSMFNKIPDIERIISRIHARSSTISALISVLNVLESCQQQLEQINSLNDPQLSQSRLLSSYLSIQTVSTPDLDMDGSGTTSTSNVVGFPNLTEYTTQIRKSFTYDKEEDKLQPTEGMFKEYDEYKRVVKAIEKELDDYLETQKMFFKTNSLVYKHMGKEIYQIEVPVSVLNRVKVGAEYVLKSDSKTFKRFHTQFIEKKVQELLKERDRLEVEQREVFTRIQEMFNQHYQHWQQAVYCLAHIDCLMSLCRVSHQSSINMCRPHFIVTNDGSPCLDVLDMRHPAITIKGGDDFIPNDLKLGQDNENNNQSSSSSSSSTPSVMVLTGPNMGGKSTLLRQACILVVMAQLGCYVPSTACKMTVFDRIFTRLGANDDIMAGQSTFMTELRETSSVLRHATKRSLVIMDELGRGTSTFDGYSIAFAVLQHIAQTIKCTCIFATHYQSLANEPAIRNNIATAHMSCTVDDHEKRVVFLYKLVQGVCPDSYGLHVGAMAGIPIEIVHRAEEKSKQFEKESTISSYVHGTINRTEAVRKLKESCQTKDYNSLLS